MNRVLPILFFLTVLAVTAAAQADSSFRLLRVMEGDFTEFTVDNLDNIYVLSSRNQVKKFNVNGDSVAVYNDVKRFGRATLIDVSNPLKILLYYRDFATVVMLDRFLNAVNTIDLRRQNIFQAKAIGQSYDNKIWVYDEMENKLKKVDEDGKLLQETPDFRQVLGAAPSPQKLFDENRYVYMYDPAQALYVFDYFGVLKSSLSLLQWQNFKVVGTSYFGSRNDSLLRYTAASFRTDAWKMPAAIASSHSFNFSSARLYALRKGEEGQPARLSVYTLR